MNLQKNKKTLEKYSAGSDPIGIPKTWFSIANKQLIITYSTFLLRELMSNTK